MGHYDVVIIGGGPAGIITGVTGKRNYPEKRFLMIKEEPKGLVPCGIPYVFHDLGAVSENEMGPKPFVDLGGEVLVDTVRAIDPDGHIVTTETQTISFEKLVLATGSEPIEATFIKGHDQMGVHLVHKSHSKISALFDTLSRVNNAVIIGGGFIGVELGEQLVKAGKKTTIIEKESRCLLLAFSPDACEEAEKTILDTGIELKTGRTVVEITGENNVANGVLLDDGTRIEAEAVICTTGYLPRSELAGHAGIKLDDRGAIIVDNYLRTSAQDVFAVGDCAGTQGFITGRTDNVMLASTATAEARTLGYNLFSIRVRRPMAGTLCVFSTEIGGRAFASAGVIEQTADEANIDYRIGKYQGFDRHPATFADTKVTRVRLVVSPSDGTIIGAEMCGGKGIGEMINTAALAIQKQLTVYELVSFQIGTHPLLTSAPTQYPLIVAAENAIKELRA